MFELYDELKNIAQQLNLKIKYPIAYGDLAKQILDNINILKEDDIERLGINRDKISKNNIKDYHSYDDLKNILKTMGFVVSRDATYNQMITYLLTMPKDTLKQYGYEFPSSLGKEYIILSLADHFNVLGQREITIEQLYEKLMNSKDFNNSF